MSAEAPPADAAPAPTPAVPKGTPARSRRIANVDRTTIAGIAVVVIAACGFVAYRWWQAAAGPPIVWGDSLDYARSAIWAGSRPPLVPAILALSPSFGWFVALQTFVAIASWGVLAWAVAASVPSRFRPVAIVVVLAFASTTAVVRWERSVLSESLATSALALLFAALLWASARTTWPRVAAVIAAGALFAAARDTDVWVVWLLAVAVAIDTMVERRGVRGVVAALALAACAGAMLGGGTASDRSAQNIEHVYFVRVFPYPDRVDWFEAHGMPDADTVREYASDATAEPGSVPVVGIDHADTRVPQLVEWLHDHGTATYLRYMIEHPTFVLTEPARRPERAYNFGHGSLDGYSGLERTELTAVDAVLTPEAWLVIGAAAGAIWVLVALRRSRVTSGARIALALAALGLVHMLVAWHGDGMETTRHAVVGNVQARLGVLVLVVLAGAELMDGREREHAAAPDA